MKKVLYNLLLIVAVAVFLFSAWKLITIQWDYHKGKEEYKKIEKLVIQTKEEEKEIQEEKEEDTGLKVDWDTLQRMNPQVKGWIRFEEPSIISYPIVQGEDNDFYLTHSFEKNVIHSGAIFMDYHNNADFSGRNTFVYGHNMNDGSMFAKLKDFESQDFWKSHPYFSIYTPDGRELIYEIFAIANVNIEQEVSDKISFNRDGNGDEFDEDSMQEFMEFVGNVKEVALYDTNVSIQGMDKIVSLYTCTNRADDERRIVYGVLRKAISESE